MNCSIVCTRASGDEIFGQAQGSCAGLCAGQATSRDFKDHCPNAAKENRSAGVVQIQFLVDRERKELGTSNHLGLGPSWSLGF